jgi:hypothetical protein
MASLASQLAVPAAARVARARRAARVVSTRSRVVAPASGTSPETDSAPTVAASAASPTASPPPAASPVAPPSPSPPSPAAEDYDALERQALVRRLLGLAAATSRGQQADRDSRAVIEDVLVELEFLNPTTEPARAVDGEWCLVYANVEAFRSSPFFWGFQKIVPGGEDLAKRLFEFTAGLPVAGTRGPFGQIQQTFSLESNELVSEVEMKIFDPFFAVLDGISGTVVSTANVKVKQGGDGDTLLVAPRTTRVRNANVDQIVVPTSDLMSGVVDGGAVEAEAVVTYVDDTLRVTRVGENLDQVFVYTRKNAFEM